MCSYYCALYVKLYKSKLKLDKFEELMTIDFIKSELKPVSGSIFVFFYLNVYSNHVLQQLSHKSIQL